MSAVSAFCCCKSNLVFRYNVARCSTVSLARWKISFQNPNENAVLSRRPVVVVVVVVVVQLRHLYRSQICLQFLVPQVAFTTQRWVPTASLVVGRKEKLSKATPGKAHFVRCCAATFSFIGATSSSIWSGGSQRRPASFTSRCVSVSYQY